MTTRNNPTRSHRVSETSVVQNFHLIWIDGRIDEENDDNCRESITRLRQVVNTVNTFTDVNKCIDFIDNNKEEKIFIISSGALGQTLVPAVHEKTQVSTIYIFCGYKARHEEWAQEWSKIKGVFTDIKLICEALKQVTFDRDQNSIPISFVQTTDGSSNQNLNTLDHSFMYTQILKEILLTINFEQISIGEFLTYARQELADNTNELKNVDKIAKEYYFQQPIWWYTYESFLSSMLNRALRTMEVDLIVKIGFFVRDLHNHIVHLHAKQLSEHNHSKAVIMYRAQGLSQTDFDQLKKTQGGLLSFNNFLFSSINCDVSLDFVQRIISTSDLVGVLFVMKIDPSIQATPFANIKNDSCYPKEEEILFSMHSIFRIEKMKQLDGENRVWQVQLTLINDNDPQLHTVTKRLQEETKGLTGWYKLGKLMIKLGHFNQAEKLYELLLKQTNDEREKSYLFQQLGRIKDEQGKYEEAVEFYEKLIRSKEKILSPTDPDLIVSYNYMGQLYHNMGEHLKALSYYEKVLEIRQKISPGYHSDLAQSYNNIGAVYCNMSEYSKALSYSGKALEIYQRIVPANHPSLAQSYNDVGAVYYKMGDYTKALSYSGKALEIRQSTPSVNHLLLGQSYNNIGAVYYSMGDHSKAFSYSEKTLEIYQKTLPENHPDLAVSYNNIGQMYNNIGEYSKALSSLEKALKIRQKVLPTNHSDLAQSYNNIGAVYYNIGEYSNALSSHKKALEIKQKTLGADHPDLAISHNNIGWSYRSMNNYSKALSYFERALHIKRRSLPPDHPSIKNVNESIESIKKIL